MKKYLPAFLVLTALLFFLLGLVHYAGAGPLRDQVNQLQKETLILQNHIAELEEEIARLELLPQERELAQARYFQAAKNLEQEVAEGISPYRIAYLTFDDGPFQLTYQYLKVLEDHDALATFFVLGKPDYLDVYQAILERGHTLGNHTYSHKIRNGLYNNPQSFLSDVKKLDAFLWENFQYQSRVFRFPGGSRSAGEIKEECIEALHEAGYGWVDWNALTRDAEIRGLTLEAAYDYVMPLATSKDFAVLLMHDFNSASLGALPTIIQHLRDQNYVLLPLFRESLVMK
jgi:peptidoglycan/xylan/chitin deacetylase (PgdA/CDA1 family)